MYFYHNRFCVDCQYIPVNMTHFHAYYILFLYMMYKKPAGIRISLNTRRLTSVSLFTYTLWQKSNAIHPAPDFSFPQPLSAFFISVIINLQLLQRKAHNPQSLITRILFKLGLEPFHIHFYLSHICSLRVKKSNPNLLLLFKPSK